MNNKKKVLLVVGLGLAGVAIYMLMKKKKEQEEAPKQPDPLDNPIVGAYQGTKPRSVGNSTSTDVVVPPATPTEQQYTCVPAMDSEGGGKGKYISIDDPHTPKNIEAQRRQLITDQLSVGDTIYLDGNSCKIKKFWKDSQGRNGSIQCENHTNRTFNSNSKICW
tara:strand:+ start:69 stop:560 length:492 start_codon:yes stop_codon:yes gene_type:complete